MTVDEFKSKLNALFSNQQVVGDIMFISVKSMQSEMIPRIFERGEASDGSKIGSYSSNKEIYISDPTPREGTHKGKPNQKGEQKETKTSYYENYKEFRNQQRRETGFVNLRLFDRLKSDFSNAPVILSEIGEVGIKGDELSLKKAEGNEARFGKKIFLPTKEEKDILKRVLSFEINKAILSL